MDKFWKIIKLWINLVWIIFLIFLLKTMILWQCINFCIFRQQFLIVTPALQYKTLQTIKIPSPMRVFMFCQKKTMSRIIASLLQPTRKILKIIPPWSFWSSWRILLLFRECLMRKRSLQPSSTTQIFIVTLMRLN